MSQITKDPLGNDVEVLSLTEWSEKNQRDLDEDTLNQYAGYATGQLLRAGQSRESFENDLYSGLFQKGQETGIFQPQSDEEANQQFQNFTSKPFVNDALDLDLVSKSLLDTEPEQAAKVADVYQRLASGQADPNLDLDLEDVKKNIATPDRIQQARIDYAKERGLAFIDYPTGEPGKRDVWINDQVNPDRNAIYGTLETTQGIVDPRVAQQAEEWIKTDPGRSIPRYKQRKNAELQSLIQNTLDKSEEDSALRQGFGSAIEYATEAANEYGLRTAEITAKAPTDEVITETYTPYGPSQKKTRTPSLRVADTALRSAYKSLKNTDPNSPLVTDFTEEDFVNAGRDMVLQQINTGTNQDDPTKNFVTLTDGSRVPLSSAATLPKEKFNQAMDQLGLDDREKAAASTIRTGWISANLKDITDALYDFEKDEYVNFYEKNKDVYKNDVELTEAYLDQMKTDAWKTFNAKTQGVLRSIPMAFGDLLFGAAAGASILANSDAGEEFFTGLLTQNAEQDQRRRTYTGLYGSEMGLGYTIATQAAPLLADIAISRGAASLAKAAARPVVTAGIRTAEGLMGQTAKSFIANSLKTETKGLVGNYLKSFAVGGAEKSPAQILRAVRRDLEEKFVTGAARATQIGTGFTRSAQGAYVNTSMRMRDETNPDGTPKYTEDQIKEAATTSAIYSGAITALVEHGFGRVFGEGADVTTLGNANIRQLKYYSNRLTNAVQRGGLGGQELLDTVKQVSQEIVKKGWTDAAKQVPAEALEEFTDEFSQNVVQSLLSDEQINFKDAFRQGLEAAVVGGVYGGAFGSANKIGLRQADVARDTFMGTAQGIERDILDQTITKLQESGGNPQTVAALQDRMRVAQRRGQAVSQAIPVRPAVKQELVEQLDATSEEPIEIPTAPASNPTSVAAKPTKLASQLAKELAVNDEELSLIPASGTDREGNPLVTPNDVRAFVNRRTEQMGLDLNSFLPGPDVTAPEDGFQLIGEERADDPENRTFNDLKNRVVVIDGLRGRLRVEDEGVILDPENGSTPFEVTPNKDLPIKDFEGFNTLLQEGAQVSPRRQQREVSEVTEGGEVVYGDTSYDLPEQPLVANVKRDAAGEVESMHMRVFNNKGLATWVYVAGDNVPKVETAYRVRGPEAVANYGKAVETAKAEDVRRNAAAQTFKAKQSRQRRKDKRIKNNAPLVTDRAQRTVETSADYRVSRISQQDAPQQLVDEVHAVALQLGMDPEVVTDNSELFAMVAGDLAAGLDLESFTPQQRRQAVENLRRNGNNPETLLEYLVSDELLDPRDRVNRDSNIAKLRTRNSNQLKKHGIKPGADVKTILENVARSASDKNHRESAKALLELGAYNTPTTFTYLQNNIGTAGAYLPNSNAVVVNLASDNGGGALDAMLHELGHAVTDRALTQPRNEFEQQMRDKILSLRAEYMQRAIDKFGDNVPADLRYALEGRIDATEQYDEVNGAREMVAHFYGSSKFRDYLVQLSPNNNRSLIQKFIDLIASIFNGKPAASKQYKELAETITDLSRANQTLGATPYARTPRQISASRAAINQANKVGQLVSVPNPHEREDIKWISHQVQTLSFSKYSNEEFNELILNGKFGMLTGEFPNAVEGVTEAENARLNKEALKWLKDRGYEVIPIIGHYKRGENSFLVPGLTAQDAVDASYELNQESIVTNDGSYNRNGMFSPRTGQTIDEPIQEDDAFLSAVLDKNGNVTTMRVHYDFDTVLDSGLRYSKQDTQAAPTTKIARSLADQGEFAVAESNETNRPLHFENGVLIVNPALAEARYEDFDVEDSADLQELDARLAIATGLAVQSSGPEIQLDLEEVGLSPETVIEQAAYNTLTKSDLEDLLKVKEQAKQLVVSAYYHVALRNNGSNERLATAQNRLADLYRYLLRDGADASDIVEKYSSAEIGPVTTRLIDRAKPPLPIVRYSRAAVNIDPKEVRGRTKAGATVGTRNPTSAKATEDGSDPSNTVDLASLKRNPKAYRKNALLLLEYPIVAREFPKLAKEYAKLRNKVLKAQSDAESNGNKTKSAKHEAKKILAEHLGISVSKVKPQQFEDARENPDKEVQGKQLRKFKKALETVVKFEQQGIELVDASDKASKDFSKAIDAMAVDPKHAIAKQADEIYETLIEVTESNLEALMNLFPESLRDIANLWYDGANIIAQQFAGDKYTLEQSAAVLAVFSPQKDWFMNVELGKRTMEIWTDDQDYEWDDAMSARWLMRGGEPELKENKDGTVGYAKGIKPDLDENGEHRTDENGMLLFHGWSSEKVKAKRQQAFERLQSLKGKKLKDLTPEQQAWFVRMRAETKYETSFPIVSPDGRFGTPSTSTNNKGITKEIKLAWGTYGSIGKAISILTAPPETQMKVISNELGDQHKVRSFYNNIVDPQSADGHVTMDTHAIAALFWQAFSGNSREVSQNFGSAGTAGDSLTGVSGLYPAFAEAYRRAGAKFDLLPRQVQSITWEAVRMLFPAKWKSKKTNVDGVRAIWDRYQANEISLDEARTAVFAMVSDGKDLATAITNSDSDSEDLGLGFPSWADVVEGPAPAGAGIARSRAITQEDEAVFANSERRNAWSKAAKEFLGARVHPSEIPVIKGRYMRISDMPKALQDLATVAEVSKKLQRETDMAGNDILDIVTSPVETDAAWYDLDAAFRNKLRTEFDLRTQALDRIKKQTKGLYTDSEIITYAMNLPTVTDIEIEDTMIGVRLGVNLSIALSKAGLNTAPKAFRGRMVQLTHWSKATELKQTDPTEHGNGGAGEELKRRREYGDIYLPRTYFGYGKYHREQFIGANRYSMLVNGDTLYDLDRDPLDLYPDQEALQKAGYARFDNRAAKTLYEKAIKDAGFKGYVSTSYQAGVLFNKQKVAKVKDGNTSLPLAPPETKPRFSKALYAIVSPDVESAYAVSLDDLYINNATGEWDAGGPITNLFRAAGDLDPRLFEASKYQERGLRLAKGRLKDLIQGFKAALKAEPNADLDDINVALGSTEPTVSASQREAAASARRARVDKANEQFDRDPANQAYAAAVEAARVAYATHRNKQKYTAEIQQARDARKNSPEMQQRDAAIAAADAQYAKDIRDARAKNLIPVRRAQQQAQLRLEANSPETAKVIAEFRVAIDNLSAQLSAELGPSNPLSAIVDQNLGVYLTRSYRIHQDEGYAERVLNDSEFAHQREQARQFFEREWINDTYEKWRADVAYEPYSDAEVMSLVRAEAASKNVGTRDLYKFVDRHGSTPKTIGRTTSRTDLTRFMQKGEVPAELRPLLGEIQNPIENAMRTYANLAQFLGTQRLLSQYTQLGLDNGWLVPAADVENDPVKYRGYKPLVNTTDTRGGEPLSEYYAEPDVVEAFKTMFNPSAEATRSTAKKVIDGLGAVSARAVGTSMGALTLGSAGFFMRNITGILTFVGANGFVPTPSNIATAWNGLAEVYYKNMEGLGADLTMLGLTEDSLVSSTMRDFMRNAIEDPETVTDQIESILNELSTPGNWLAKSWKTAKVGVDALVKLNDQIDAFYKVAYWAHEIDVQTKANEYRATPLTPQQIKQEAARVVRLTTQGRERVAPIAKEFGRSGFGLLLNSFFRFTAEMYRLPFATTQLGMQEIKSGNPVLKKRGYQRLIGLGSVLAFTGHGAQALLRSLLGFGDDEEEAIRKGQPVYNRDANLFFTYNQEERTVSVFDITYVNGFSPVVDMFGRAIHHATNGRWEKVPGTILTGMAKNFVSPQIAVEALAQASTNTNDYGAALWLEDDSFAAKGAKFLKHVIGNAYKLKTPTNFYKAFAAYANNGVYDKEAALKLADKLGDEFKPFRVKTDPVEVHAARSFRTVKREMDAARKSLNDFNTFESLGQKDVDDIYSRYENSSIAINERLNKFARGFQQLGLSYKQLQKIAYEEADISKNRFEQAVKYGRVERFVPSDDAMETYKNRGGDNGEARVQYIKQAYKKRPRYTYLKKR